MNAKQELNKKLELHMKWLNNENGGVKLDLQDANLQAADLRGAYLLSADLQGANIDYSCLPLWCGGLNFKIDERQAKQLMYHVINLMQYSGIEIPKAISHYSTG